MLQLLNQVGYNLIKLQELLMQQGFGNQI